MDMKNPHRIYVEVYKKINFNLAIKSYVTFMWISCQFLST